jgi:carbon monoxide dehydrogenase subunit G
MEFDNAFDVPLAPAEAWKVLMDVQRIAPCLPGAELIEVVDATTYKGKVAVRLGPVALTFAGTARFEEMDEANRRARVKAQGTDAKGRGGASAVVDFRLEPKPGGTHVLVHTNLNLTGAVAQYGRGAGMIKDLASTLIGQFADCLKGRLAAASASTAMTRPDAAPAAATPPTPLPVPGKPISGFTLLWATILRRLKRLFGGGES